MATVAFRIVWFLCNKTNKQTKTPNSLSNNSSLILFPLIKHHKEKDPLMVSIVYWTHYCLTSKFKKCTNVSPSCKVWCQHHNHVVPEVPWYRRIPTGILSLACHFCVWVCNLHAGRFTTFLSCPQPITPAFLKLPCLLFCFYCIEAGTGLDELLCCSLHDMSSSAHDPRKHLLGKNFRQEWLKYRCFLWGCLSPKKTQVILTGEASLDRYATLI